MRLLKLKIAEFNQFFQKGVWEADIESWSKSKRRLYLQLRTFLLAFRSYEEKRLVFRASALTYFTLLSIVPILAMAFGIAQGFGLEEALRVQIMEKFAGQEAVISRALEFAHTMLEKTQGGVIAGIGFVTLAYSVVRLLIFIEQTFNDIWEVEKPRSLYRKFTDYTSFITIAPIIFILSSSLTVFVVSEVAEITQSIGLLSIFEPILQFLFSLIPYCLIWVLLTMIYMIMPNTQVKLPAAFIAGILAGTAYQLLQWGMLKFQIGVSRNNAIYGSFAALPIFLFWLQLSWIIVLLGAAYAQAYQNIKSYSYEKEYKSASIYASKVVALGIMHVLAKCFSEGQGALTQEVIVEKLEASGSLVKKVLSKLIASKLVVEVIQQDADTSLAYQPALDVHQLKVMTVLSALEAHGNAHFETEENSTMRESINVWEAIQKSMQQTDENILIKDLETRTFSQPTHH